MLWGKKKLVNEVLSLLYDQAWLALLVNFFLSHIPHKEACFTAYPSSLVSTYIIKMDLLSDCCCHIVFIDQISCGKKNVLTAKDPYQLGVTSGTSGKSSMLPTTNDVGRIFFTSGVLVGINAMFEAYPGVKRMNLSLSSRM